MKPIKQAADIPSNPDRLPIGDYHRAAADNSDTIAAERFTKELLQLTKDNLRYLVKYEGGGNFWTFKTEDGKTTLHAIAHSTAQQQRQIADLKSYLKNKREAEK